MAGGMSAGGSAATRPPKKLLDVRVRRDAQGRAAGLEIVERGERSAWAQHAHGAYLLRTNCTETDPVKLWRWYIQLQRAEAAFRTSKSDLALRPVYHQKTERVEAHILVCFLALALWRTLEMWVRSKGLGTCARQLLLEPLGRIFPRSLLRSAFASDGYGHPSH
jgi:hypothetical protein